MASSIFSLASTSTKLLVLVFLSSTAKSDIDIPPTLSLLSLSSVEEKTAQLMLINHLISFASVIPDGEELLFPTTKMICSSFLASFPTVTSCNINLLVTGHTVEKRLGVRSSDATSPPDDSSQGLRFLSRGFHCIGVIMMSVALALWN
ncbi:hypothetical protein L1987_44455 [Smallanthus sonchifolius]|uniref:Uncharacterized protein n=1 Tax=Smallanthus sonchifolius TaxID=185202 RepID=A0ACB9GPB2_9ASTR|nr:hypothetical protein L1987_44455 [Smallanthus sonchifolius]